MQAITVTVEFVVLEHGWVKAEVLGLPVETTGRDRADAESSIIDGLRAYFVEASQPAGRGDARDCAELCLLPAEQVWRSPGPA